MFNAATVNDITRWYDDGAVNGYDRMIIWCDSFDYSDYPEYTNLVGDELLAYTDKENGKNMKRLMEVYDLTADRDAQLGERRAFHY